MVQQIRHQSQNDAKQLLSQSKSLPRTTASRSLWKFDQRLVPRPQLLTESGTQSAVFVGESWESQNRADFRFYLVASSSERMAFDGRDSVHNATVHDSPNDTVGTSHLPEHRLHTRTCQIQATRNHRHFESVRSSCFERTF